MANGNFGGGDGTTLNPYLVEDAADLNAVRNNLSLSFLQKNDIDMSSYTNFTPIGGVFSGSYNGSGYKISNLRISSSGVNVGLFEYVNLGYIAGVHITNSEVNGSASTSVVGGLAGTTKGAILKDCSFSGNVYSGYRAGGLVGFLESASFETNTYYSLRSFGSVRAVEHAGGLVGSGGSRVELHSCYSESSVVSETGRAGGICSSTSTGSLLQNCYASGDVTALKGYAGGISAYTGGNGASPQTILKCYTSGSVSGFLGAGGIVGEIQYQSSSWRGIVLDCYVLCPFIRKLPGSTSSEFGRIIGKGPTNIDRRSYALSSMEFRGG